MEDRTLPAAVDAHPRRRLIHLQTLAQQFMGWVYLDIETLGTRIDKDIPTEVREHCAAALAGQRPIAYWTTDRNVLMVMGIGEEAVAWDPFEDLSAAWDLLLRARLIWPSAKCLAFLREVTERIARRLEREGVEVREEERPTQGVGRGPRWPFALFFLTPADVGWSVIKVLRAGGASQPEEEG